MKKIKIALVGLGVVGKSVYEILIDQIDLINKKSANKLELTTVCARSKKDFIDEKKVKFIPNALDLVNDKEIDVIIEVVGGADGAILELWQKSLKNGKKIVSANKAIIATKGFELAKLAQENGGYFAFEASVAGAIPIVKIFRESFSSSKIESFYAILNGTCNYILTKMQDEKIDFDVALKQAQEKGYAETDPTFDIEGIDSAHKLAILTAIASSTKPNFDKIYIEGITKIKIEDIILADELGYKIKLLAIFKNQNSKQTCFLYPALLDKKEQIANVDDSFNAIFTKTSNAKESFVVGRGAGGIQTASAIVSDLIDIANDRYSFEFALDNTDLVEADFSKIEDRIGKYFIRIIFNENADKNNLLSKDFLEKIKVQKSHFYENAQKLLVCGLISDDILEKEFKNYLNLIDKNLVKELHFIRVE